MVKEDKKWGKTIKAKYLTVLKTKKKGRIYMRFVKNNILKKAAPLLLIPLVVVLAVTMLIPRTSNAQLPLLDPAEVRLAVQNMGMDSLSKVILTDPPALLLYVRGTPPLLAGDLNTNPPTPAVPTSLQNFAAAKGISVQRAALQILGKALFWDQQVGSDGQACASCHFLAGGDNRLVNTLNPGTRNTNAAEAALFNPTRSGGTGAPNYTLTPNDFPFHVLADMLETNYMNRDVLFDTDDPVGSIGTFHATFAGSPAPNYATQFAQGTYDTAAPATVDPVFSIGGKNTRSNGPRQAASMINAVFNFRNFWDGRAANTFNGFNPFGAMDQVTMVKWNTGTALTQDFAAVTNSSLASQAVGPPQAATSDEMAFGGRTMPDLGRKLLRLTGPGKGATATATIDPVSGNVTLITVNNGGTNYIHGATVTLTGGGGAGATATAVVTGGVITAINIVTPGAGFVTAPVVTIMSTGYGYTNIIPLGAQQVSSTDSVMGNGSAPGIGSWTFQPAPANGGRGINLKYANLIQWAFVPQYWDGTGPADVNGLPTTLLTADGFHLMESNFSLFWGLAIQEYETTLRSDQTPYDRFMAGDDTALTQDQMRGLLTYIHTESAVQQVNPIFNNINFGACQLCHSGPELTENTLVNVPAKFFITTDMTVKMDHNRELAIVPPSSNFDVGFSNVGTRPNREDIGIGGTVLGGLPLSFYRAGQMGFIFGLLPLFPAKPNLTRGTNTDGAFKIPSLRNIEITGPYFHHGGSLTLKQSVEFYARHGDFADVNEPDIDVGLAMVQNIGDADANLLVSFLLSLTDERVRWEMAPFDHPQLFIPNGHPATGNHPVLGSSYYPDNIIDLSAVGALGRSTLPGGPWPSGNSPIPNFLGVSSTPVAGTNNDHFDP